MNFEKDIFISYAHDDNEPLSLRQDDQGWIDDFHRSLELRIKQLLGEKPKIWRDPKLQGNHYFGDEIAKQLPNIALLISILSPRYVNSDWCKREVQEFFQAAQSNIGYRVGNKSRVFKVVKTPIPQEKLPEELKELLGYNFFKEVREGKYREFNKIFGEEAERDYWERLEDLAHDIVALLQELKSINGSKGTPDTGVLVESTISKGVVYLAQTISTLEEERDRVRRELSEHGYQVVPDQAIPDQLLANYSEQVTHFLEQSDFSIHLFGSYYGKTPDDSSKSLVVIQNEIAAELSRKRPLERLIWIDPKLEQQDDSTAQDMRQIDFINALRTAEDLQHGAEIFESSISQFKIAVIEKLKSLEERKEASKDQQPDQPADQEIRDIYIICDESDRINKSVIPLKNYLFDQGYEVILPVFKGEDEAIRMDHQENLKNCDAVIIFYGAADELWMRAKDRELKKIMGYGRNRPFTAKGIYLHDPDDYGEKEDFKSNDLVVINGLGAKKPEAVMHEYLQKLKSK